jgi:hypothetical protein
LRTQLTDVATTYQNENTRLSVVGIEEILELTRDVPEDQLRDREWFCLADIGASIFLSSSHLQILMGLQRELGIHLIPANCLHDVRTSDDEPETIVAMIPVQTLIRGLHELDHKNEEAPLLRRQTELTIARMISLINQQLGNSNFQGNNETRITMIDPKSPTHKYLETGMYADFLRNAMAAYPIASAQPELYRQLEENFNIHPEKINITMLRHSISWKI